ncbi:serine hydrolase [Ruminococcus sp. Marseille-P6503]|uniref:D-alanyl-D-alanine carboxypeptidase family protein n=1 Tax=Ruminococcus sp. Marseille-P6503 TaxID=2364796 RepID=UPI000F51E662|nr:serine hydrolase [Ruminococcus sp. Marseille-P6503]
MLRLKKNEKGGAAVVAVMIIIMIVAIGSAIMVVTGRGSINEAKAVPAIADESSQEESQPDSQADPEPAPEKTEPETLMSYPKQALDYEDISIKELTTKYGILIDADSNTILAGKNYEKKIYPASLTKVMTLIVAVENIDDFDAKYKFTSDDIDPLIEENASRAGFEAGESVTYEDLLYSAILVSGADGTAGLANAIAGSEDKFVEMMNDKAKELGLTGTHFENASGLHNKNHYSTCQDIAVIMEYAMHNDECMKILTATEYTTAKTKQHEDGIKLTSIVASRFNGYYIEGGGDLLGGKTGFTDESGYSLVSIAEKDGVNYVCVTVKSEDEWKAVEDNIAIYEKYLPSEDDSGAPSDSSESASSDE